MVTGKGPPSGLLGCASGFCLVQVGLLFVHTWSGCCLYFHPPSETWDMMIFTPETPSRAPPVFQHRLSWGGLGVSRGQA